MQTRLKRDVPPQESYLLSDLENPAKLIALLQAAEVKLKPCPCCGNNNSEKILYLLKMRDGQPVHYFQIMCHGGGCGLQSVNLSAADEEEDIQRALDFIGARWNRRSGDPALPESNVSS
jgi:hypothetical protein